MGCKLPSKMLHPYYRVSNNQTCAFNIVLKKSLPCVLLIFENSRSIEKICTLLAICSNIYSIASINMHLFQPVRTLTFWEILRKSFLNFQNSFKLTSVSTLLNGGSEHQSEKTPVLFGQFSSPVVVWLWSISGHIRSFKYLVRF